MVDIVDSKFIAQLWRKGSSPFTGSLEEMQVNVKKYIEEMQIDVKKYIKSLKKILKLILFYFILFFIIVIFFSFFILNLYKLLFLYVTCLSYYEWGFGVKIFLIYKNDISLSLNCYCNLLIVYESIVIAVLLLCIVMLFVIFFFCKYIFFLCKYTFSFFFKKLKYAIFRLDVYMFYTFSILYIYVYFFNFIFSINEAGLITWKIFLDVLLKIFNNRSKKYIKSLKKIFKLILFYFILSFMIVIFFSFFILNLYKLLFLYAACLNYGCGLEMVDLGLNCYCNLLIVYESIVIAALLLCIAMLFVIFFLCKYIFSFFFKKLKYAISRSDVYVFYMLSILYMFFFFFNFIFLINEAELVTLKTFLDVLLKIFNNIYFLFCLIFLISLATSIIIIIFFLIYLALKIFDIKF
jgi:hypothetical protein